MTLRSDKAEQASNVTRPKAGNFDLEKILLQIKRWQEKLLDMSKSNPLLGLNRARAAKLKITDPIAAELFLKLVLEAEEIRLPFVKKIKRRQSEGLFDESGPNEEKEVYEIEKGDLEFDVISPADLRRKLRRIYDNARTTIEERGVVTLHTTFGAIRWHDDVLGESMSPILLVPCELISKGPNAALRLKMADDEIQLNPAIVYYFREKHKVNLPELPTELDQASLKAFFKKIEKLISEQEWQVSEDVWLGTFSFESLVIYQDLKYLTDQACTNPIIAAFAHASREPNEASEALGEDLDSLETPEVVPVPVLPVDSSQLKALTYAASARSLVIHGPPGTGKSQTISNIIADALGKNKKVLFVSAKMAALNVVFDRLKQQGLGQFCLEAHGTKAGKLKIIEELKRTLESDDTNNVGPLEQELESLQRTRKDLNEYVNALHTVVNPLGLSVFQAIGRFAKLEGAPYIKGSLPWQNILEVSEHEISNCFEALMGVSQMASLFDAREKHPWRGFGVLEYSLQLQEKIESDLKFLEGSFKDIGNILSRLGRLFPEQNFSFADLATLSGALDAFSKIRKLPENWWKIDAEAIQEKKALFEEAVSLAKEFNERNSSFQVFSQLSFQEAAELLSPVVGTYKAWTSRISIAYFKWRKSIKSKLKTGTNLKYRNVKHYFELAKRLVELDEWFGQKGNTLSEEVALKDQKDPLALGEVVIQCQVAFLIRESLPNYKWSNSEITSIDSDTNNAAAAMVSLLDNHTKPIKDRKSVV